MRRFYLLFVLSSALVLGACSGPAALTGSEAETSSLPTLSQGGDPSSNNGNCKPC
jgi:hypothetical protein